MQENTPTLYVEINESDYIFAVTIYDDVHNFKIVEKNIVPHDGIKNNKFINIYQTQELIKKNVQHIENKLNFIFKEVNIILGSFDCYCINVSGFKKLNGSQVLKENISYILNLLKLAIADNEKDKTILHIFNSKSILDGKYVENLPIGLFGNFYSHELTFFLIEKNDLKNIKQLFSKNNLRINKLLSKNFIEGIKIINKNDNINTFFKIKINKDNSYISFFDKESFRYIEYFSFGTNIIFKDIIKICSISKEFIEEIFRDELFTKNFFEDDEILEQKYFSHENFRKIRKNLIKDIVTARIEEIINIIFNKNINLKSFKKSKGNIYIIIEDELINNNFRKNFKSYLSQNYNFAIHPIYEFNADELISCAAHLSSFGWKKEAIPIAQTKNSIITRIFKSLFG